MAVAAVPFQKLKTQTGTHLSLSELSFGTQSKGGLAGFEVRLSRTQMATQPASMLIPCPFVHFAFAPIKHYRLGTIRSTQIREIIFAWTLSRPQFYFCHGLRATFRSCPHRSKQASGNPQCFQCGKIPSWTNFPRSSMA